MGQDYDLRRMNKDGKITKIPSEVCACEENLRMIHCPILPLSM